MASGADVTEIVRKIEEALAALRVARRRGRPCDADQLLARKGVLPVATAAQIVGKRISTLYKAGRAGKLRLLHVGEYWYVDRDDVLAYALTPARIGRPPKARPEGADAD